MSVFKRGYEYEGRLYAVHLYNHYQRITHSRVLVGQLLPVGKKRPLDIDQAPVYDWVGSDQDFGSHLVQWIPLFTGYLDQEETLAWLEADPMGFLAVHIL